MGNCCRHKSSAQVWAGDNWGSEEPKRRRQQSLLFDGNEDYHVANIERQRLLDDKKKKGFSSSSDSVSVSSSSPSRSTSREVKIKITRRELEAILMARVDMQQGLSMGQVLLDRLINASDHRHEMKHVHEHHRPWKPALQSIPEVN